MDYNIHHQLTWFWCFPENTSTCISAHQGDKLMVSGWRRCGCEVAGFSLLRSNHASEAGHPWFISIATGIGDSSFNCTSIIPCKTHIAKNILMHRAYLLRQVLILKDHNPSAGKQLASITIKLSILEIIIYIFIFSNNFLTEELDKDH